MSFFPELEEMWKHRTLDAYLEATSLKETILANDWGNWL